MWHTATLIPCPYAHAQIKHFTSYESDNGARIKPRSTIALWHVATQIPCPYALGLSKSNLGPQACSITRLYDIIVTNLKRSPLFTLSNYAILLCKMHYQIENVDVPPNKKIENVENFGHMESESLSPIFVPQNTDKNKEAKVVVL